MPRTATAIAIGVIVLAAVPSAAQVINEFVANHTGSPDTHEYVEIAGLPNTDYSNLTILHIEGDIDSSSGSPGVIDDVFTVGLTDADGYWVTPFLTNTIENGSQTLLLVSDFSGTIGEDLDTNDDGVFDSTPWSAEIDAIGVNDQSLVGDRVYTSSVLVPGFDGDVYTPGGASRLPDGIDTDSVDDWTRNDFSGEGLPGYSGTVWYNEAFNTPGEENRGSLLTTRDPIISEFVVDHAGVDSREFIEVFATAKVDYSSWSIIVLEGDIAENPGRVESSFGLGTTDVAGFWFTGFLASDSLENGSLTMLVARDFTGSPGDDLDIDDDGIFDSTPWSTLADTIGIDDGGAADIVYGPAALSGSLAGGVGTPGGASRHPYFHDSDTDADWFRNDFDGEGLGLGTGTTTAGEAFNTPGAVTMITVADYYAEVDDSSPAALRASLHPVIDDHIRYPYSSADLDTWDILEEAQQDPTDPGKIIDIYENHSYVKGGVYNREHTWAKTYGFGTLTDENSAYTDTHHLFLCNPDYNSHRGNSPFEDCTGGCSQDPTVFNPANGQGGTGIANLYTASSYEVWPFRRGDVARAQFYMAIRYEGGTHDATGFSEPDLELIDGPLTTGQPFMGQLSTLLEWHAADPVDAEERARNDLIYSYQGNRNPFVDNPQWVTAIFLDGMPIFVDGFESGDTTEWSAAVP